LRSKPIVGSLLILYCWFQYVPYLIHSFMGVPARKRVPQARPRRRLALSPATGDDGATMSDPEYVAIEYAGQVTGVPARTLRRWAAAGKVPVVTDQRKRLVRLDDVRHLAAMTGHRPATTDVSGASAGQWTGHMASDVADDNASEASIAVSAAARSQLEAVRDEWLQPLIDQLREVERALGRTETERDQARHELDRMRAESAGPEHAAQDANTAPLRDDAPQRPDAALSEPFAAPGRASDSLVLGWRRWWRRITGGS